MAVDYASDLQAVTRAVRARVGVEGHDAARLRVVKRDDRWHATVTGHAGQHLAEYTVTYRPGRRPVVMAGTAQHGARPGAAATRPAGVRPADNRPAGRRDTTRPDPARMAQLDLDGLAAYALELLDAGLDAAGRAVLAEMERREEAEKAAAAAEQDDAHRRARALSAVDRRRGETTRQALRREHREWLDAVHYPQAEAACSGHMLSARGQLLAARGELHPLDLFTGPTHHARAYASEELLRFWEQHGRMTLAAWSAQYTGGRRERAAAATPTSGRDFL